MPLNAIKLTFQDFIDLTTSFDVPNDKVVKMINYLHVKYYKYSEFAYDVEYTDSPIRTNIVFKTIDDIINFFYYVLRSFNRVFHTEEINWKPFVKKFRSYLN